jgi:hypothetical protein
MKETTMEMAKKPVDLWEGLDEPLPPAVDDATFLEAQARAAQEGRIKPRRKPAQRTPQQKRESFLKGERTRLVNLAAKRVAWQEAHPVVWKWLVEHCDRSGFANSLIAGLNTYGSLTERQTATVERFVEENRLKQEERARAAREAPSVSGDALLGLVQRFEQAEARGLKSPRIRAAGFVFSLAKVTSANPGAVYVKQDGTYLGKVTPMGHFVKSFACDPISDERVREVLRDPKAAAIAYGRETGRCSICNRELTDPQSVAAGIGPICANNYGW